MWHRTVGPALFGVVLVALIAGPSMLTPAASTADLVGTWNGLFWWLGGNYWEDEGTLLLQIKEDGTP